MAYISKRGDLQWRARVRRKGFPALSKTFETKAEAEVWAGQVESEMRRGGFVSRAEAEATSLYDALDRYEGEVSADKKGVVQEKSVIRALKATDLAMRPMAAVRSADVAALRDEWAKTLKPATVLRRLAVLSNVFTVARKEWRMESLTNPVELVRKPKPNNARTRRLAAAHKSDGEAERGASNDELERVIQASESATLPAIIRLAVETAMRRSEIVALRWGDIDLKRRVAHLSDTKNGTARDVPLSSKAIEVLSTLKQAADEKAKKQEAELRKGKRGRSREIDLHAARVFGIRSDAVTRAYERAVERARKLYVEECQESKRRPDNRFLVDLRFHDLRHEATSRLASVYQLHELTKVTGHKDPRMLMRYYHPDVEELAKRLQ